MSKLWSWVDSKNLTREGKVRFFLFLNCSLYSLFGFLVWLLVSQFGLSTPDWSLCFVCYSVFFIGYVGGFVFLSRK